MRAVIQGWSGFGLLARVAILVLTGVTWAASSVQFVIVHPDYWNPVSAADFFAVYAYSTAWLLSAASLLILREAARPALEFSSAILVVAAACAVAGVANTLEDALGLRGFGSVYVIGVLVGGIGMFVVAAMSWRSPARRLTFVPAVGGVAMVTTVIGGGVLGIVAWLGFGAIVVCERLSSRAAPSAADAPRPASGEFSQGTAAYVGPVPGG